MVFTKEVNTSKNVYFGMTLGKVGPSGRAVYGVGLQPLACLDCGFESYRRH
jgi:hypothetical protein